MNSIIKGSRLLPAVALCGAVLAGCDSVTDVRDEPFTAIPAQTAVLGGTIQGLGTIRPLILQNNGQDTCVVPVDATVPSGAKEIGECRFVGVQNSQSSSFNLGSPPVGSSYNITVKRQPYGKICTVANPTGTVGADSNNLQISCVNDDSISHYTVTANIAAAAAAQPGLKVTLTTENGTCPVDATGRTSITFDAAECPNGPNAFHENAGRIWGTGTNLPVFGWRVTATIPGATPLHPVTNCWVTGGPVENTGGNIDDDGAASPVPSGNVTVNVNACVFTVRAAAIYSLPTVPLDAGPHSSATPPAIPAGEAISLVLREQPSGVDVAAARITSFVTGLTSSAPIGSTDPAWIPFMEIDADGNPTTMPYGARSSRDAFFEVVVTGSPAGMACIPGGSSYSGSNAQIATGNRFAGRLSADHGLTLDGGAVLLRNPASVRVHHEWVPDKTIRCRLLPEPERQLRGIYHQGSVETRTQVIGGAPPVTRVTDTKELSVLALFEDGTYLFGFHVGAGTTGGSGCPNCGVQQGFYHYDPLQSAIRFIPFTATTTGTSTSGSAGLHGKVTAAPGSVPIAKTLTGFHVTTVNGRQVLRGTFTPLTTTSTTTDGITTVTDRTLEWYFSEIGADPYATASTSTLDGAWVTWDVERQVEDRRRVMVYQHSSYVVLHMGVNGIPNLQMLCYAGNLTGGALSGTWTRLSNTSLQFAGTGLCNQLSRAEVVWDDGTPPESTTTLRVSVDNPFVTAALRNFPGRWPQSEHNSRSVRNELVPYEIRLAGSDPSDPICPNADKLTVTEPDVSRPPIVLCKVAAGLPGG